MASIFVSYSRKDSDFAHRLAADLDRLGADVWIDLEDIPAGKKWSTAVQQGLRECEVMIIVISPDSMASDNVEDEWQYFLDRSKLLIPVLWRPAEIHFQLNRLQYVDFHESQYEIALTQLRSELQRHGIHLEYTPTSQTDPIPHSQPSSTRIYSDSHRYVRIIGLAVFLAFLGIVLLVIKNREDQRSDIEGSEHGSTIKPTASVFNSEATPPAAMIDTPGTTNTPYLENAYEVPEDEDVSITITRSAETIAICPDGLSDIGSLQVRFGSGMNEIYTLGEMFQDIQSDANGDCWCLERADSVFPVPSMCSDDNTETLSRATTGDWRNDAIALLFGDTEIGQCDAQPENRAIYSCLISVSDLR